VADVVQVERSALDTYVGCHEDPIMIKGKQRFFVEQGNLTTKAIVVRR